ncbi:hypothetical protein NDU88_003836 [Pleurodeles waltl]|uniref:Uncharacterized protein n=1 Tax=Pleurodeles waltl TaxID=8319 RepID=A0AAV7PEZ8_PLEWA|nr:hypothetical protein NDU88_003836 [Pleurodeles waltl]
MPCGAATQAQLGTSKLHASRHSKGLVDRSGSRSQTLPQHSSDHFSSEEFSWCCMSPLTAVAKTTQERHFIGVRIALGYRIPQNSGSPADELSKSMPHQPCF